MLDLYTWTSLLLALVVAGLVARLLLRTAGGMASPDLPPERESGSSLAVSAVQSETERESEWRVAGPQGNARKSHPLYKRIAVLSGEVNALTVREVKERLEQLGHCKRGIDQILYRRLKHNLRTKTILSDPTAPGDLRSSVEPNPYGLDYLCVLDFEATCEAINPPNYIHEIIEFPVLLLNLETLEVEDEFHFYCRPFLNSHLSDFCKTLTGIRQDQVNRAPYFSEVIRRFEEWLETKGLGTTYKFTVVTDCPWDIRECLFPQCVLAGVPFPQFATKWIDMRKLFASFYQLKSGNLDKMLEYLGMKFEGRQHCGLDDTRNIARIVVQMVKDGCVLKYNRFIPEDALGEFGKRGKR